MEKGNVLVLGKSGVGKSTLINAVLGEDVAKTGWGTHGTTDRLEVYESVGVPFRVIDTIGFVPNIIDGFKAIQAVREWSKECAKKGDSNSKIDIIWFCIDGTSRKLFEEDIKAMTRAASFWKSVPVIVVITKSYSVPDREDNIKMVNQAFSKVHSPINVQAIMPVVAQVFKLNDTAYAPPEGIPELIEKTNEVMPEGMMAASNDLADFVLSRKRILAQSVIAAATTAAAVIGAIPIGFPDATLLIPTETAEINFLAKIYGIDRSDDGERFLKTLVEAGSAGIVAKGIINMVKNIPGMQIPGAILNAVIAGAIAALIGEVTVGAFEQVYLGNKTTADVEWIKQLAEEKLSKIDISKIQTIIGNLNEKSSQNEIAQAILNVISGAVGIGKQLKENNKK